MPKQVLISVYDTVAEYFAAPRMFRNRAEAIRSFEVAVNNSSDGYGQHPESFVLYQVGEFDENSGNVTCEEVGIVEKGINLVRKENQ